VTPVGCGSDDDPSTDENGALIEPLAEQTQTTVCTYDRTGLGASDPPSKPRRTLDDATVDLDEEFPGALGWKNPEHLDYVDAERTLAPHPPSLGDISVSVVTATDGASSVEDQSFWLALSTDSQQKSLTGDHDLTSDNQGGVIAEIHAALDAVRE